MNSKKMTTCFIGLILSITTFLKADTTESLPVFSLSVNEIILLKPEKINLRKIETVEELKRYYYRKENRENRYDIHSFYLQYYFFLKFKYIPVNTGPRINTGSSDFLPIIIAYDLIGLKDVITKDIAIFASGAILNADMEYILNKYSDSIFSTNKNTHLPFNEWYDQLFTIGEYDTMENKQYCTGKTFYDRITFQKECTFCRSVKEALEKEPVKKLTPGYLL
jgi:hypothetical protein